MDLKLLISIKAALPVAGDSADEVAPFPSKKLQMKTNHELLLWFGRSPFLGLHNEYK